MKLLYEVEHENYSVVWHYKFHGEVIIRDTSSNSLVNRFNIAPIFSGCGAVNFYHFTGACNPNNFTFQGYSEKDWLDIFDKIFKDLKNDGVGAIYFTLGQGFPGTATHLVKLGFENVSTYKNYRHGSDGRYEQSLFMKKL